MTINPCCIPLKTGVRMVTHLSMALALAVGWTALKLISISSEVSSNGEMPTGVIRGSDPRDGSSASNNFFIEQHSPPPPPPQSFYNAHIFESHQVPPQYRIPYQYILYHKWHQQQMMQQHQNAGAVDGYNSNLDSHQRNLQQNRPYYDDAFSSWYQQYHQRQHLQPNFSPSQREHEGRNGFDSFPIAATGIPILFQVPPPPSQQNQQRRDNRTSSSQEQPLSGMEDEEDEHSKIFRSVLQQRKNFKGVATETSSSLPPGDLVSRRAKGRNSTRKEEIVNSKEVDHTTVNISASASGTTQKHVQRGKDEKGEGGIVSQDRSTSPHAPLEDEKPSDSVFSSQVAIGKVEKPLPPPSQSKLSSSLTRRHWQQRKQPYSEQPKEVVDQVEDLHELDKPRAMMMMMIRENSQRNNGAGYYGGITGRSGTSTKKPFPDFKEKYAKTLLICGLLALCTVVFQFLTSFLLLCFVDKGSNAAAQIWTAVHCSVIFCLATCLVLFLCEGLSMSKYIFDETLYLSLVTIDSLLSIYFLWVVMAFI